MVNGEDASKQTGNFDHEHTHNNHTLYANFHCNLFIFQNGIGNKQGSFLQPERCKISNNYFPNCKEAVMSYDAKVFCGTFSRNGKHFLTASQG